MSKQIHLKHKTPMKVKNSNRPSSIIVNYPNQPNRNIILKPSKSQIKHIKKPNKNEQNCNKTSNLETHQKFLNYIDNKKKLYKSVYEFIVFPDEDVNRKFNEKYFQKLNDVVKNQGILTDCEEMQQFLQIIKNICDNHHRGTIFITNIFQLLQYYKNQIKQILSNNEIYRIFENNKILLLFLIKNDFISISDEIYREMICKIEPNDMKFCYFFYPEIESFIGEKEMLNVKKEILMKYQNIENYEEKRKEGQNDSYICSLIRQDSVEEFIAFVNCNNYSLSSQISPSVFETNAFLIENKNTTLIEYAAFFGSIQIFRYLLMNGVELKHSLWIYAIHSENAELVHLLESIHIPPPKNANNDEYEQCYFESIKCHHNDIAEYIENNYLCQIKDESKLISISIQYHNFSLFQNDVFNEDAFFNLCFHKYYELVVLLLKTKEKEIESKIIFIIKYFYKKIISSSKKLIKFCYKNLHSI